MTNDELDKLKELAERATSVECCHVCGNPKRFSIGSSFMECRTQNCEAFGQGVASASFKKFAAVSPDVVLKLVAEVKRLQRLVFESEESERRALRNNESLRAQLAEARELIESSEPDWGSDSPKRRAYLEKYPK